MGSGCLPRVSYPNDRFDEYVGKSNRYWRFLQTSKRNVRKLLRRIYYDNYHSSNSFDDYRKYNGTKTRQRKTYAGLFGNFSRWIYANGITRSEERRVGKEGRAVGWA